MLDVKVQDADVQMSRWKAAYYLPHRIFNSSNIKSKLIKSQIYIGNYRSHGSLSHGPSSGDLQALATVLRANPRRTQRCHRSSTRHRKQTQLIIHVLTEPDNLTALGCDSPFRDLFLSSDKQKTHPQRHGGPHGCVEPVEVPIRRLPPTCSIYLQQQRLGRLLAAVNSMGSPGSTRTRRELRPPDHGRPIHHHRQCRAR